ncbi:MAG: 5-bromo-4-chloroindolyl phosphate hydrolysis family protein [Clostridia bacterium]|nr:5-bromo-4-chloroindolyl phosphate hydrolysis family protein [Clostridia bacterium]
MDDKIKKNAVSGDFELRIVRSPVPFYGAAVSVILCAFLLFSFLRISNYYKCIICAASAILVYLLLRCVFPPAQVRVVLPHIVEKSGNSDTDRRINDAYSYLYSIEASGGKIVSFSASLASDIADLTTDIRVILSYLEKHPDRISLVRRFIDRVIPMLDKICRAYIEFAESDTGVDTRAEIEDSVTAMKESFKLQIDKLYADRELDISSDIAVLESILGHSGVSDKK